MSILKNFTFTISLATLLLYAVLVNSSLLKYSDNKIFDIFSSLTEKKLDENSVVIIDIDEKSLNAIGQWPWSRVVIANLINKTLELKPSAIAIDFIFPELDRTSLDSMKTFYKNFFKLDITIEGIPTWLQNNDKILAQSIKNSNTTLPLYLQNKSSLKKCQIKTPYSITIDKKIDLYKAKDILCNNTILQDSVKSFGFINATPDKDGIFRRLPTVIEQNDNRFLSLGIATIFSTGIYNKIELVKNNFGNKIKLKNKEFYTDKHGNILLNFYQSDSYKIVSAYDLLTKKSKENLQNKLVLIGTTAVGLHDHYTIRGGKHQSGVFMHATFIENIFNDDIISQPDFLKYFNTVLSLFASMIAIYMMHKKSYLQVTFFSFILVGIYILFTYIGLKNNFYFSSGYFLTSYTLFFALILTSFTVISYVQRNRFYEKLSKSHQATLESMALVAETRDTETGAHIIRTKKFVRLIAQELLKDPEYKDIVTKEYVEAIYHAAPLHDIGKVGVPDSILKKPAKLTFEEFQQMKKHSSYGYDIVENAIKHYKKNYMLEIAKNIAHYHHEKWDGTGYPKGLKEKEIPLEARIMALADVYDALMNKRCYKPAFELKEVEQIIIEGRGTHFEPKLVDIYMKLNEEFYKITLEHKNE